jgi:hypothetical protein
MTTEKAHCSICSGITITPGTFADYEALAHFHYRAGRPAAITRILAARYHGPGIGGAAADNGLLAGILVETLPSLACALRAAALNHRYSSGNRSLDAARLNREMRTIARVIIHPIFRGTGLAIKLVQQLLSAPQTPYIEALAAMARINPFFQRASMHPYDRPPLPAAVRLCAALAHENLRPIDLADSSRCTFSPFLSRELLKFAGPRAENSVQTAAAIARTKLLSQPVYYLWASPVTPP